MGWSNSGWRSDQGGWYKNAAPAGYIGPGDVKSGAKGWWGLRAYSTATIGSNVIQLKRHDNNATQDFATITGGGLDMSAIATFLSGTTGEVSKLYDQTGNGQTMTEFDIGSGMGFIPTGLGSLPTMRSPNGYGNGGGMVGVPVSATSIYTVIAGVMQPTGGPFGNCFIFGDVISTSSLEQFNSSNNVSMGSGTTLTSPSSSVPDATFHALAFVHNTTSSAIYSNGSSIASGNAGSNGLVSNFAVFGASGQGSMTGDGVEIGYWPSALNSTDQSNLSTNMRTYWGF